MADISLEIKPPQILPNGGARIIALLHVGSQPIGDLVRFDIIVNCKDANFFWWPGKDCRPVISIANPGLGHHIVDGLTPATNMLITFGMSYVVTPDTNNKHCVFVDYSIFVYYSLEIGIPPLQASVTATLPFGGAASGSAGTVPLITKGKRLRCCCDDCIPTCIDDPPQVPVAPGPLKGN